MTSFDINTIGRPAPGVSRHPKARAAASLVAAAAGAIGLMVFAFLLIAGLSPAEAVWAWAALAVLVIVWATGLWWRWDSPDHRDPALERERRGF